MKNYKKMITYYIFNKIHRENGPAHVSWYKNGQKMYDMYYINGEYHREDGPAIKYWYMNGQKHEEIYYLNNQKHREDGPAYNYWSSVGKLYKSIYYLFNTIYDKSEWIEKLKEINSPYYEDQKVLYDMEKYNL